MSRADAFEERVAAIFRQAGWKVSRPSQAGADAGADLVVRKGGQAHVVELKWSAEGRRDRLVPLLAQAILQAQAYARASKERISPMAIVGAERVGESLLRDLDRFAADNAPDVAIGVVDLEGFQWFKGLGLERFSAQRDEGRARVRAVERPAANLFSDLNQWMLKVLLAPRIPDHLLNAPRGEYRNASQLAGAANVSIMSAFRFLRQLQAEGFLDEGSSVLGLVRISELLGRWRASNRVPAREVPMQWILRGDPDRQLQDAVRKWAARPAAGVESRPSVCLALFAAADALGLGFVRGVAPHVYAERVEPKALQELGLSLEPAAGSPDVVIRMPAARESVFRGAVDREGVPVSDVLQVWLDTGVHPSRGQEQADLIYRRVLQPIAGKMR